MSRELVSNYRETILDNIMSLNKDESVTIKNMTNMEMVISPIKSDELFEIDVTNCEAIYKSIKVPKEDLEYYISTYQKATTKSESYNIYLLASKGLRVGHTIEIIDDKTGDRTLGVISEPNRHYYGLFYKSKNPFSKLKTIDLLLDTSKKIKILNNTNKIK